MKNVMMTKLLFNKQTGRVYFELCGHTSQEFDLKELATQKKLFWATLFAPVKGLPQ